MQMSPSHNDSVSNKNIKTLPSKFASGIVLETASWLERHTPTKQLNWNNQDSFEPNYNLTLEV